MTARAPIPAKVLLTSLPGKKQGITTGALIYFPFLQVYSKNALRNILSLTLQWMCLPLQALSSNDRIAGTGIRSTPCLDIFFLLEIDC